VQKTGTDKHITYYYSRAPHQRVMFEVLEDWVGTHFMLNGSKCTPKRFELMGVEGYHRSCFDNLAEAIAPYGLTPEDVPEVCNLFMHVGFDAEGRYAILPPTGGKGDYIDMRAQMDCLVALSACPAGDLTGINGEGADAGNKRLKVEFWDGSGRSRDVPRPRLLANRKNKRPVQASGDVSHGGQMNVTIPVRAPSQRRPPRA